MQKIQMRAALLPACSGSAPDRPARRHDGMRVSGESMRLSYLRRADRETDRLRLNPPQQQKNSAPSGIIYQRGRCLRLKSTRKRAYQMMKNAPYNFIGNIEGRQIPFGDADVVVADGFTGNLILKTYEGVAKVLMQGIKDAFYKNTLSKISYLGVRSGINDMKAQFDYKEYGGAVMLGVKKPVIKAHGSADARCFKNAIKQAVMFLKTDLINKIEKELQSQE